VNVTKHKLVDLPVAYSGKAVCKEFILTHGIGNLQVPFDLGSFRKLKERAEGSRHTTFVVDVVFNPLVVQLFMDDEFCSAMEQRESPYRPWLLNLALKRIEESIGVKLSAQKVKLVKQCRYKDGEDGGPTPREFMELPGDRDSMGVEDDYMPRPLPKNEEANTEPLIQDCTPGQRSTKPAMKKGFLNNKDAAGSLYGPEGSKEGVLPENAGDPMGWMPKKLRNTAKIIDCNSPEYQAQEKAKKAAEESNAVNQEFRDSLLGSFDKMQKKQRHNHWETDLPDGTDDVIPIKYNNDYARFDKMDFGDDEQANQQPERDWYVDTKGNMHHRQPSATGSRPSGYPDEDKPEGAAAPAVKKGFLDSAKKPLYGPEGSAQGKSVPDVSEEQMMRDFKNMMGEQGAFNSEDLEEAKKMADGEFVSDKKAQIYVKIMQKVKDKGVSYVESELARVRKIMGGKITPEKAAEMNTKVTILSVFADTE